MAIAGNLPSIGPLEALNVRGSASKFLVVFDSFEYDLGSWSKVSGLGVSWEACEYRRGKEESKDMPIFLAPGPPKYSKVALHRAACLDSETVQSWLKATQRKPRLFSGAVMLLSPVGLPLVEWRLEAFFPTAWRIGDFDSKAANVVIETLEIAHTGFLDN